MRSDSSLWEGSNSISQRTIRSFHAAFPKAMKTALWLLKIMIPVTFGVLVLNYTGLLAWMADRIAPLFVCIGLPGESAFVLLTSIFTNIYSAIAVITSLGFTLREGTILAMMCLISHGFIIESAVVRKTGSSVAGMLTLRLLTSLAAGLLMNLLLPEMSEKIGSTLDANSHSITETLVAWGIGTFWLTLKIILLVTGLMFLQKLLEEFGIIRALKKPLRPLMRLMGLPVSTTFSWIVAYVLGLAYGSAIIMEEVEQQRMTRTEADLLNHHIVVSHSQLEDPLLFAAIGIPMGWIIWPRIVLAILAVWLRRGYNHLLHSLSKSA